MSTYHHGDLRQALIEAGLEILTQHGQEGLSLRKVAKGAGVSHAAPYRHFDDKEALLAAIAEQGFLLLTAEIEAVTTAAEGLERLHAAAAAYLAFGMAHTAHLRLMFGTVPHTPYPDLTAASHTTFLQLVEIVEQLQTEGLLSLGDPTQIAQTIWAHVHGVTMLVLNTKLGSPENAATHMRRSIDLLVVGIGRQ